VVLNRTRHQKSEVRQRILAAAAIRESNSIVIACHVNPDGDALGSLLGLGLAIEAIFPQKSVDMVAQDGVPFIYRFLPGAERIRRTPPDSHADLAIVVDSGDVSRVGSAVLPAINTANAVLDIDHHVGEGEFGTVRLIDNRAAATAEIVFDLITELGVAITPEIATCLFTGVITDTGSFRFMNVTPRTLRVAASLIESGASPSLIAEKVFDNRPFEATRLLGLALGTLSRSNDGRICWASVTQEAFKQTNAADEDTEGFINSVRAVRGVEVALLFREVEPGRVRISLRSTDSVDVARIANRFQGGGHRMAAGCTVSGTVDDAVQSVVAAVRAALP
jgi:phosphoesterase RecJ-like protein